MTANEYVSIHAPAWGATCCRLHCGFGAAVSIHAPAWGATIGFCAKLSVTSFQSTRPHGARLLHVSRQICIVVFQSTRPHGARRRVVTLLSFMWCFNPRARMGRDMVGREVG